MTKDEAIAAAEALAKPTWDKPVKVGWHGSNADYGHISVDDNDIVDVQFYGSIESKDPDADEIGYFLDSVRDVVALAEEVNTYREVMRRLRKVNEDAQGDPWKVWNEVESILGEES